MGPCRSGPDQSDPLEIGDQRTRRSDRVASDIRNVVPVMSGGKLQARAPVDRQREDHRHRRPQIGAQAHEEFERQCAVDRDDADRPVAIFLSQESLAVADIAGC